MSEEVGHILVVDDNRVNRKLLCRALEEQGHNAASAVNGREALERVRKESFDVVLLDILMPEMDGYEVLATMKADPELRHIPIIMISAVDEMESAIHCIEMGAADYLPKPFNASLLRARTKASLTNKHLRDLEQAHLREVQAYLAQIQEEKEKSERLLLNVLPVTISERLKQAEGVIADSFPDVTVLFADVVGFTSLSERLTPKETVVLLNEVFTRFDQLANEYGVEKIRTIGDGYMAAAGAPLPRADHALVLAEMAVDMQHYMAYRAATADVPLQIRIGINSGPAVAGIVGTTKFHYDIWGDMVNTASRMESHGQPGKIQIARQTYELIKDRFACEYRGKLFVKGKGDLDTWFLSQRRNIVN